MSFDTFLSYSRRDKVRVSRVRDFLKESQIDVWMDREQISLGSLFRERISEGLLRAHTITPILTKRALRSKEVFKEVQFAITHNKKVVPVVLNPKALADNTNWRNLLKDIDWGDLRTDAETRNLTDDVLRDIKRAIVQSDERRCPIITFYHFKGGVGKTTLAALLAAQLYESSKRSVSVCLIDCDAQSNMSSLFLTKKRLNQGASLSQNLVGLLEPDRLKTETDQHNKYGIAIGEVRDDTVTRCLHDLFVDPNTLRKFSIVPNDIAASKYGRASLDSHRGRLFANFQNAIQKLSYEYDYIIIDCNPSTNFLSECALDAATDIVIPLKADKFTTEGLDDIDEILGGLYELPYAHGSSSARKQTWVAVNFADLSELHKSNLERVNSSGPEAELLKSILQPDLKGSFKLQHFSSSLLDTRVPASGFLRSKPVATDPLDARHNNPAANLLSFGRNRNAARVKSAIEQLAIEIRDKVRSQLAVAVV